MRRLAASSLLAALALLTAADALARDGRPLSVPRDQAAEAVRQLSPGSGVVPGYRRQRVAEPYPAGTVVFGGPGATREQPHGRGATQLAAFATPRGAVRGTEPHGMDPAFLPRTVGFARGYAPGTIVVDTGERYLYLVEAGGQARRYGVGVGKDGFGWRGTHNVTRKAEWPTWTPPAERVARERLKGRYLPARMEGGEANPLGARALYLGSTLYRIHGTNQPWTIGQRVSSGCIRMRNEDVIDLYERVPVGARVVVL